MGYVGAMEARGGIGHISLGCSSSGQRCGRPDGELRVLVETPEDLSRTRMLWLVRADEQDANHEAFAILMDG